MSATRDLENEPRITVGQVWQFRDPFFGMLAQVDLAPGVWTDEARDVFLNGNCHSLAVAVARVEPRCAVVCCIDDGVDNDPGNHVMNRFEDRLFDARGWRDGDAEKWDRLLDVEPPRGWEIKPTSWDEHHGEEPEWLPLRVDDAIPFALRLVMNLGIGA